MIVIDDLSFKYHGKAEFALRNISLKVKKGEFLGLTGSSGSGKTTLLRAMTGVAPHRFTGDFYGKISVGGLDSVDSPLEKIAKLIGSVSQDIESQIVSTVVEDEIVFGLENFGVRHEMIEARISDALEKTGITALRNRNIATLSGGQKQKVAICSIIALMPEILILDEPTGELDPQSSRQIFMLLKELNEKHGMTIVVAEQDVMLLCEFVDRLAVINKGEMLFCGDVREVLSHSRELMAEGVNCPRVVSLADKLMENGLYSGEIPLNIPQAEMMVRSITV